MIETLVECQLNGIVCFLPLFHLECSTCSWLMIFILCVLVSIYEGSTTFHNIPLLHGQVKVGVEEVKDAEAPVPVPTDEVKLVGQILNTFLA